MKKILSVTLFVVLLFSLYSCSSDNISIYDTPTPSPSVTIKQTTASSSLNTQTEPAETATVTANATATALVSTAKYKMLTYSKAPYSKSKLKIEYPSFTDSKYDAVNDIIYAKVLSFVGDFDGEGMSYIDYSSTVTLVNSKIISIVFWGSFYTAGAAHPNDVIFPLNIDLASLKEISLKDMYNINARFSDVFLAKAKVPSLLLIGIDDGLGMLKDESLLGSQMEASDISSCFLKPDGIVICVSVPFAVGNYVEGQLQYSDVQQFYLLKQNYWED